jgi:hypothetical protein
VYRCIMILNGCVAMQCIVETPNWLIIMVRVISRVLTEVCHHACPPKIRKTLYYLDVPQQRSEMMLPMIARILSTSPRVFNCCTLE